MLNAKINRKDWHTNVIKEMKKLISLGYEIKYDSDRYGITVTIKDPDLRRIIYEYHKSCGYAGMALYEFIEKTYGKPR